MYVGLPHLDTPPNKTVRDVQDVDTPFQSKQDRDGSRLIHPANIRFSTAEPTTKLQRILPNFPNA